MRLAWRSYTGTKVINSTCVLGLVFTLSSCSFPDLTVDKQHKRGADAGAGFFQKIDDHGIPAYQAKNSYLATVRMRFSDNGAPVNFDIHRSRSDLIAVNMQQSEQTSTYLHLGYTHSEGGIAGLRFTFRF